MNYKISASLLPCCFSYAPFLLKQDIEGAPRFLHASVLASTFYEGDQGVKLFDTQVNRKAKSNGSRNCWCFSTDTGGVCARSTSPGGLLIVAPSLPSGLAGANRVCGACDSEFRGQLMMCVCVRKQTHEICVCHLQHKFHQYASLCLVCQCSLTGLVLQFAKCTCTAHAHCTTMVGEAIHCKACCPSTLPKSKTTRHMFKQHWNKGC